MHKSIHSSCFQIEEELDTKIYPGTEVMTDVGTHHFLKSGHGTRVLVPQPSSDPHDPLVSLNGGRAALHVDNAH